MSQLRGLSKSKSVEHAAKDLRRAGNPIVADWYRGICAICYYSENAPIESRLVSVR
jgi:hypothetical protein